MKKQFSIKLYRSPLFKAFQVSVFLVSLFFAGILLYSIFVNLFNGISLYELFYKRYAESFIFKDVFVYAGTYDLFQLIFSIVYYLFLSVISFLSLINNEIAVFDDHIKIRFAPRYLNIVVNIKNITDISLVEREEIPVSQRFLNFNFSKKYLYKITTKYKQCIIVSCSDEANLNQLKELIDSNFNEEK